MAIGVLYHPLAGHQEMKGRHKLRQFRPVLPCDALGTVGLRCFVPALAYVLLKLTCILRSLIGHKQYTDSLSLGGTWFFGAYQAQFFSCLQITGSAFVSLILAKEKLTDAAT